MARTRRSTTASSAGAGSGVFDRIFAALGRRRPEARAHHDRRDPSEGPPHRGEPAQKGDVPRRIGRTKGGLNSKLHAVCDGEGRPIIMLLTEGQISDHKGAASCSTLCRKPMPHRRPGLRQHWFREALHARGIEPCIPSIEEPQEALRIRQGLYRRATRSRTCSADSRTGGASQPATTAAPTPSSPPSASQPPSSSGCD